MLSVERSVRAIGDWSQRKPREAGRRETISRESLFEWRWLTARPDCSGRHWRRRHGLAGDRCGERLQPASSINSVGFQACWPETTRKALDGLLLEVTQFLNPRGVVERA